MTPASLTSTTSYTRKLPYFVQNRTRNNSILSLTLLLAKVLLFKNGQTSCLNELVPPSTRYDSVSSTKAVPHTDSHRSKFFSSYLFSVRVGTTWSYLEARSIFLSVGMPPGTKWTSWASHGLRHPIFLTMSFVARCRIYRWNRHHGVFELNELMCGNRLDNMLRNMLKSLKRLLWPSSYFVFQKPIPDFDFDSISNFTAIFTDFRTDFAYFRLVIFSV